MKVLRIIARLNVGGPARHVVWLTDGLSRAGHQTLLVTGRVPPGEDDMSYVATEAGVTPVIIPQMSREVSAQDVVTIWKLFRLMLRERPDIVHTHTAKAGTVGRVAGFIYRWLTLSAIVGRPRECFFVHTYHGHIFHSYYGRLKTKLFLGIEKILTRMTDRVVVISPQQHREIHEEYGVGRNGQFAVIREGLFAIIPIGLDTKVFANWEQQRQSARAAFGLKETDLAVGIVGRLTKIKNHEFFINAAARYKELFAQSGSAGPRVRFIIIGDGELRNSLEARAASLGLQDDVVFAGLRRDPESFYAALDVVTLTSLNEGTPLTLIEAMANARPIVATAVGGVPDLLGDTDSSAAREADLEFGEAPFLVHERGISVNKTDVDGFCRGLKFLLERGPLRREMGERGREFVAKNYSKDRLVADVLALYETLGAGTSAPAVERKQDVHAA